MESGRHFGRFGYPCEIAFRPRAAETKRLRRSPVEITHVRRKGFVAPVESAWQGRTEHTEVFLRRIDLHGGGDLLKMILTAPLGVVAMGDNCEIQLPQVDALGLDIVRENLRVIASIKQDALTTILDERGKSPVLRHRRGLAEGVVKNRDLRGTRLRVCRRGANRCR